MTIEIIIPRVGETTSCVTIIRWLKQVGEYVTKGEPLLEVETDKATLEIESFGEGVLQQIFVPEGGEAQAMQVVAVLEEIETQNANPLETTVKASIGGREMRSTPAVQPITKKPGIVRSEVSDMGMSGAISIENIHSHHNRSSPNKTPIQQEDEIRFGSASPKARRLAKEAGIDLSSISGSGPDGLVIASDIERESLTRPENEERVELPSIRRTIAARMAQSKQTIPHFYLFAQVDMLECQRLRILCKDELNWERKPSYTDLIVKACSSALTAMPEVNVRFEDNTFVRHDGIHIGIAVGLAEGLIVKVIRDVNLLSLRELVVRSQVAIEEAKAGQLKEPDIGKKCMVVSNLGMEGVDAFAAIIDPPDAMILTVGKVTDQVVPIDELPCVRPMCTLVLSVDHRVLDGVGGSRFLMQIKSIIENPFSLL